MRISVLLIYLAMAASIFAQTKPYTKYSQQMLEAGNLRSSGKLEQADEIYSKILKNNHRNVDALIGRGFTRLRMSGRAEDAWKDFQKASVLSPDYIEAYVGMASCMKRLGKNEDAEKTLERGRKLCGKDQKKLVSMADLAWDLGHWDWVRKVDSRYTKRLSETEQKREAYRKKLDAAWRLRNAGLLRESEKMYKELLEERPDNVDVLIGLAFCKMRSKNRLDDALEDFRKVIKLSPGYTDAYVGAATCYKQMSKPEAAQKALENALKTCDNDRKKLKKLADSAWNSGHLEFARELDPNYKNVMSDAEKKREEYRKKLTTANRLRTDGFIDEAEKIFKELLDENPKDVDALTGMGFCKLRDRRNIDAALKYFKDVVALSPGYTDAHVGAATCLKQLGRKDEAIQELERAKQHSGSDPRKLKYLADSAWSFGHWDYARMLDPTYKSQMTLTERQQEEYRELLEMARQLRIEGHTEEAEDIYIELLLRDPNDVDALVGLGFCKLRDKKRLDEAIADFLDVIKRSPEYIDAYIGAAICYKRSHKREELENILDQCRVVCEGNEKRMRYLAATAWREGYFPLARDIDEGYPPSEDRVLIDEPSKLTVTYGHSWVERQDDWDEARITLSHRIRPDITAFVEYDNWWRYGTTDFNLGGGISYRHDYKWAAKYNYEFSDNSGFLAEQRHNTTLRYRLYRNLFIYGGPRFSRYSGNWSRRGKIGLNGYWRNFFADASYSAGQDTKDENVSSYTVSIGYNYALRYALSIGYSRGEETVDFFGDDETVIFRSDDIDSYFIRGRAYLTKTSGISLSGLEEHRNNDLFRRAVTISLFKSF